jgi:hypothetical protein
VVDDRQLPAVSEAFLQFLDRDPHWALIVGTDKWCAYRRATVESMQEWWGPQHDRGMFTIPRQPFRDRVRHRLQHPRR